MPSKEELACRIKELVEYLNARLDQQEKMSEKAFRERRINEALEAAHNAQLLHSVLQYVKNEFGDILESC